MATASTMTTATIPPPTTLRVSLREGVCIVMQLLYVVGCLLQLPRQSGSLASTTPAGGPLAARFLVRAAGIQDEGQQQTHGKNNVVGHPRCVKLGSVAYVAYVAASGVVIGAAKRFLEDTRQRICGGRVLLRIRLAPDEAGLLLHGF